MNGVGNGGRPNGRPARIVNTGTSFLVPLRLLLRVSTNSTGPSISSMIATSAGADLEGAEPWDPPDDLCGLPGRPGHDLLALGMPLEELRHHPRERGIAGRVDADRSEEHTSELQSHSDLVCRLLLEKKNDGLQVAYQLL